MATRDATLYMVQLWFKMRRLVELGKALHLPLHHVDSNYISHCALRELFQEQAPSPFCVEGDDGKQLRLLGYCTSTANDLQRHAKLYASPLTYEICDWSRAAAKPMPDRIPGGTLLYFELRVCPVVRKASAGKHYKAGAEVDAFLSRVWEIDNPEVPVNRAKVYSEWLDNQLNRLGGAKLVNCNMKRFSLERMVRRTRSGTSTGRKVNTIKRPAATLVGTLQVTNSTKFHKLLAQGIGRHKGFGFGMLKVRPIKE